MQYILSVENLVFMYFWEPEVGDLCRFSKYREHKKTGPSMLLWRQIGNTHWRQTSILYYREGWSMFWSNFLPILRYFSFEFQPEKRLQALLIQTTAKPNQKTIFSRVKWWMLKMTWENDNRCVREIRARWPIRGKILRFRFDKCVTFEVLWAAN